MTIRWANGRGRVFWSVLETIGDTASIRINRVALEHMTVYVKVEAFNPAAPDRSVMLVMLPDTGARYLPMPLFEGIEDVMTGGEIALVRWAPGHHFEG